MFKIWFESFPFNFIGKPYRNTLWSRNNNNEKLGTENSYSQSEVYL